MKKNYEYEEVEYKLTKAEIAINIISKILLLITIGVLIAYSYFLGGRNGTIVISEIETETAVSKIETIEQIIAQKYLGEFDTQELADGMIKGYVEALGDIYSEYITVEEMAEYLEDTMGTFMGIGIYMLETEDNRILVLTPMKGSPAEEAGLLPGDYIMKVDGEGYTAETIDEAMDNIRGEEGTNVKITILRGEEELEFDITRAEITMNPVGSEMLTEDIRIC